MHRTQLLRPFDLQVLLFGEPFDVPDPDPKLAADVDHYLYGAPRRSSRRRR
jgi:hypothetical protein